MDKERNKECITDCNNRKKKKKIRNKSLLLIIGISIIVILSGIIMLVTSDNRTSALDSGDMGQENDTSTIDQMLEEKGYKIKTDFGTLYYPKKWKNQIRIEESDSDVYSVKFYATINENKEVHIFDIVFGKTKGVLLGSLDGTNVYLVYSENSYEETCNEKELNTIYEMQDDVNYIIGMLKKDNRFKAIL